MRTFMCIRKGKNGEILKLPFEPFESMQQDGFLIASLVPNLRYLFWMSVHLAMDMLRFLVQLTIPNTNTKKKKIIIST